MFSQLYKSVCHKSYQKFVYLIPYFPLMISVPLKDNKFIQTKDNILFNMQLNDPKSKDATLKIQIFLCENQQYFNIYISSHNIAQISESLHKCFKHPGQIMTHLAHDFQQLKMHNNGLLSFYVGIRFDRQLITIQLNKNNMPIDFAVQNKIDIPNGKVQEENKRLKMQLEARDKEIQELRQIANGERPPPMFKTISSNILQVVELQPEPEHKYNEYFVNTLSSCSRNLFRKDQNLSGNERFIFEGALQTGKVYILKVQVMSKDKLRYQYIGLVSKASFNQRYLTNISNKKWPELWFNLKSKRFLNKNVQEQRQQVSRKIYQLEIFEVRIDLKQEKFIVLYTQIQKIYFSEKAPVLKTRNKVQSETSIPKYFIQQGCYLAFSLPRCGQIKLHTK